VATGLFVVAHSNVNATRKSEKIDYTIDYSDESANHWYDMPYVYIFFQISVPDGETSDWLSQEQINSTLQNLLTSQNYFINRTGFIYMDNMNAILHDVQSYSSIIEAVARYDEGWVREDSVMGYFRLKLQNPDPGREWIRFCISIDTVKLSEVSSINGFNIYIARALSGESLGDVVELHTEMAFSDWAHQSFSIEYTEKVKHLMNHASFEVFESSLTWWESNSFTPNGSKNGFVDIQITTNLKVEHWLEYVEYGYSKWLAGIGGLLSVCSFVFLQVGYLITLTHEDYTMGILPELSFTFSNLEMVYFFKSIHEENHLTFDQVDVGCGGIVDKLEDQRDISIRSSESLFDYNRIDEV